MATITTPKGRTRHLVDLANPQATTLCGKRHGVNPRHLRAGADFLSPADTATCSQCRELA